MIDVKLIVGLLAVMTSSHCFAGEILYNGIRLPDQWPPKMSTLPERLPRAPYLVQPPDVIPIDVGRQLFVDDFLIEDTDMDRQFHNAVYHPANPILTYDRPWEMSTAVGGLPTACPYSGGVWYDPARKKFRMWYMGGYIEHLCLAESDDGIRWSKPNHDVKPGTNIVLWKGATESNSLLMDLNEPDPNRRFKYFMTNIGKGWKTEYRHSADGVHWSEPAWLSGTHGDRTTVFYNPFRKRWGFALRTSDRSGLRQGRSKKYWETDDINDANSVQWPAAKTGQFEAAAPLWVSSDRGLDQPRIEIGIAPQLYHLDCVAYESLMLGMFSILRGDFHENDGEGRDAYPGRPKCSEICLGFTRDGFHWHRPTHQTFAGLSEKQGDWNWGNVQSAGNSFLVVGDYLYFYVSGRKGAGRTTAGQTELLHPAYAGCSTGLAVLRRDGFASMNAGSTRTLTTKLPPKPKTLTTRKLQFTGNTLFVNVDAAAGELRVEILDASQNVLPQFSKELCTPIRVNKTLQAVAWKNVDNLSRVANKPVRFRFHLSEGRLYSFWVSPDAAGASRGYVAGGGPGFTAHHDTTGVAAYNDRVRDYQPLVKQSAESKKQTTSKAIPSQHGLVTWLKADAIEETADIDSVSQWKDSAGNGMHCEQSSKKKQPQFVRAAIGGRPAVRFDGVDDHLQFDHYPGLLHTHYKSTIFAVVRPQAGGTIISQAHGNLSVTSGASNRLVYGSSHSKADGAIEWPQIVSTKGAELPRRSASICTLTHSGPRLGETVLAINGQRSDNGVAFPYHKSSPIAAYLGCAYRQRNFWKGDIAEVLVYGRALSREERAAVESYLAKKYQIELSP